MSTSADSYKFPTELRLSGKHAFAAVFEAKCRKSAGPLSVAGRANGLAFNRLGLSVSRRVGNAVKRNLIKRRLREAFRLSQHQPPLGYDLVIVVRPHEPLTMVAYQSLLQDAKTQIHRLVEKRNRRQTKSHVQTHEPNT